MHLLEMGIEEDEGEFGSTGQFHKESMAVIWGPVANIAIFLAYYAYRKAWPWVHGVYFLFAVIVTLASSIPILQTTGVISASSTANYDDFSASTLNAHYIIGIICFSGVFLVAIMGILTKLLNVFQATSLNILLIRKIHLIGGYLFAALCKANCYVILEQRGGWIAQDAVFLILFIIWKLYFPRMEDRSVSPKGDQYALAKSVRSIRELDPEKGYVVFANYVYDTEPLKIHHPAGYQIVNAVKNREVDRYIYGSCPAEELPQVPIWSHSYKSFTLLDAPVARLDIPPTFGGFDAPEVECNVPQVQVISEKGSIYQINLTRKEGAPFVFLKYRDIDQIGRYFSVSLNNNVTRLYTTVAFLTPQNLAFLRSQLKSADILSTSKISPSYTQNNQAIVHERNQYDQLNSQRNLTSVRNESRSHASYIPIMFKAYPGGKFTAKMVKGPVEKVVISESKGEGLQLSHTKPGKIVMVIGGTGLYPFSDFIDLLYKEQLMIHKPETRNEVLELSPVLSSNPFSKFQFEVLAAFNHAEDIHPVTLEQLLFLAEAGRVNLIFKFKEDTQGRVKEGRNVSLTSQNFQSILEQRLSKEEVSRVWICGPPRMNEGVSQYLRKKGQKFVPYLIV